MGSGVQLDWRVWLLAVMGKGGSMSMLAPVEQITASTLRSMPSVVTIPEGVKWLIGVRMKERLSSVRASR